MRFGVTFVISGSTDGKVFPTAQAAADYTRTMALSIFESASPEDMSLEFWRDDDNEEKRT